MRHTTDNSVWYAVTMAYCYVGQYLETLSEMWSRGNKQGGASNKGGTRPGTATVMLVVIVVSTVAITWFIARCLLFSHTDCMLHTRYNTAFGKFTDTKRVLAAVRRHHRHEHENEQESEQESEQV